MRRNKHGNVPTRSRHTGRMFQSRLEAGREPVLLALQNAGEITELSYQTPIPIELYSTQAVDDLLGIMESFFQAQGMDRFREVFSGLVRDIRQSRQKVCVYKADFTYLTKSGEPVVEDTKGYVTPEYRLKKKLMVLAHNIEIQEPNVSGVQQRARGCGIRGKGTGSRLRGGR